MDGLPVAFHVRQNPASRRGLVQAAREPADVRVAVVGPLAIGIGVVHDESESPAGP